MSDKLTDLTSENVRQNDDPLFRQITEVPYRWYLSQIRSRPDIYGEAAEQVASGLVAHEPIDVANSAMVVLTELGKPNRPLAFLRIAYPDEKGNLPFETHYLGKGLDKPFGQPTLIENTALVLPRFEPTAAGLILLNRRQPDLWILGRAGAKIEVKHFGLDPSSMMRYFPHLYRVARVHRLFVVGENQGQFARVTEQYAECIGTMPLHLYESFGFSLERTINNEHTSYRDLFILKGDSTVVDEKEAEIATTLFRRNQSVQRSPVQYLSPVDNCSSRIAHALEFDRWTVSRN